MPNPLMKKPKSISFTPTDEECFAAAYFIKTDARKGYSDAARAQLLKNYQKIPKDRRAKHEAQCRANWKDGNDGKREM